MVKAFGAEVQGSNDPSYIGYSKEQDANNSLKKLFTGLAGVVEAKSDYWEEKTKTEADAAGAAIVDAPVDATAKAEPATTEGELVEGGEAKSSTAADIDVKRR